MAKVGRPTKYKSEIVKKTEEYFKSPSVADDPIATISGLCCYLEVSRDTIYEWSKCHQEFSDTLKAGECFQEKQFMQRLHWEPDCAEVQSRDYLDISILSEGVTSSRLTQH